MDTTDVLKDVRFLLNDKGEKTDVLVPLPLWDRMIKVWEQVVEVFDYTGDVKDESVLSDEVIWNSLTVLREEIDSKWQSDKTAVELITLDKQQRTRIPSHIVANTPAEELAKL